jgi:hypothetical protein
MTTTKTKEPELTREELQRASILLLEYTTHLDRKGTNGLNKDDAQRKGDSINLARRLYYLSRERA